MASATEILNLALINLGTSKSVANIITSTSPEAKVGRRLFPIARNQALRDANWPFATAFEPLQLIKEKPTTEWRFQYAYPVNALFFRRVASGTRRDSLQSLVPYKIYRDPINGKSIYTDMPNACSEFTFKMTDEEDYDDDFSMALSFRLAYLMAPVITKNDVQNIQSQMLQLYGVEISVAQANALNEIQDDLPAQSEIIRSRGGLAPILEGDENIPLPSNFEVS